MAEKVHQQDCPIDSLQTKTQLEFFGLPHDYLYGNGQWDSWTREAADGKDKKK